MCCRLAGLRGCRVSTPAHEKPQAKASQPIPRSVQQAQAFASIDFPRRHLRVPVCIPLPPSGSEHTGANAAAASFRGCCSSVNFALAVYEYFIRKDFCANDLTYETITIIKIEGIIRNRTRVSQFHLDFPSLINRE